MTTAVRVYRGCTTINCDLGIGGTEQAMPEDSVVCPSCGGHLMKIVDGAPGDDVGECEYADHVHEGAGCAVCADRIDEQINRPSLLTSDDFDAENGAGASDELLRLAAANTGFPPCPFCEGALSAVTLGAPWNAPGVSCGGCGAYTTRLPWREPWLYEGTRRA